MMHCRQKSLNTLSTAEKDVSMRKDLIQWIFGEGQCIIHDAGATQNFSRQTLPLIEGLQMMGLFKNAWYLSNYLVKNIKILSNLF